MDDTTSQLQNDQSSKGTDSQSSRIMSVRDASPLLATTVFFAFSTILFGPVVSVALLVLLLVFVGITLRHWQHPEQFPQWITKYSDRVIRRVKIFPVELVLLVGIVYITIVEIAKPYVDEKWYQFGLCMLVAVAFFLTELGNRAAYTGHRGWRVLWELSLRPLFSSKRRTGENRVGEIFDGVNEALEGVPQRMTPEKLEEMTLVGSESNENAWEEEQKKRWRDWIKEEMHRFDDRSSLDKSN